MTYKLSFSLLASASIIAMASPVNAKSKISHEELQTQILQMQQEINMMNKKMERLKDVAEKQNKIIRYQQEKQKQTEKKVEKELSSQQKEQEHFLSNIVKTSPEYADKMLNWQEEVTGKPRWMLQAKQSGALSDAPIVISGIFKGSAMVERTNTNGKFAILSRFPTQHSGNTGTRFIINNAALGVTGNINPYISVYNQLEYSEIEYPGQDSLQLRKSYVTIGNLDHSPFYGYFGRNTIDFGDFDSYNPFTHSVNNHFFNAVSDDPVLALGYYDHGTDIVLTGINGGRQLRVADNRRKSHVNNFAVNANQTFDFDDNGDYQFRIGGGYLHSTIYNTETPHHTATQADAADDDGFVRNGAWNVVAEYTSPKWDLMLEYTQTTRDWLATDDPVTAFTAQTAYRFAALSIEHELSAVFSRGTLGDDGTEFEKMDQIIMGWESEIWKNAFFGAEYVYNKGFVPLINIRNVSDRDVENHSLIVGGRFVF